MTKQELIEMIEAIPDCYEIDFGGDFYIKIDGKDAKAIGGFRSAKKEHFTPIECKSACQEMDTCTFYNPV